MPTTQTTDTIRVDETSEEGDIEAFLSLLAQIVARLARQEIDRTNEESVEEAA